MAKKNGTLRKISIIVTLLVIFASIVGSWVLQKDAIAENIEDVANLKEEGCDPAEEAGDEILVIKTEMKYIKGGIDDIKLEQKAMQETAVERQEAVLKAIHAIKE